MPFYNIVKGMTIEAEHLQNVHDVFTGAVTDQPITIVYDGAEPTLSLSNTGAGPALEVAGDFEIDADLTALGMVMEGGIVGLSPYDPKWKIVETGSSATPLANHTNYAPHTVYVMSADTPSKTAIWIESVDDSYVAASGAEGVGSDGKRYRTNPAIYIQHFAHKDNGMDSSAMSIMEWGQANNLSLIASTDSVANGGVRPNTIDASNITLTRTAGYNIESHIQGGPRIGISVANDGTGVGMMMGVGWKSITNGDNTPTREYADGIRIYPYLGSVGVVTGILTSDSGTATAGGATTLTDGGKAWTVNAFANYVVRLTGGTGSGQERVIASNTATAITVTLAWATNPDATTTYEIDTWQDQRAALRVTSVVSSPSFYYNGYDTFRVMLDGKTTISTPRATSTTPGAAPAYLRLLGRTNTTDHYTPEIQFGYQGRDTGVTGAPTTEKLYAAIGGFLTDSASNGSGGIAFSTRQAAADANLTVSMKIDETGFVDFSYGIATKQGSLTLSNGLNSNISIAANAQSNLRITGPSAGFSVGGFINPRDGQHIWLFNSTAQNMTIVNEDGSSTAANRILTLTGADVVQSGVSCAHLMYSTADSRWILVAAQA